jgi:hypothetical protein
MKLNAKGDTMKYKPDWPEAQRRLTALWNHELFDRPCIAVKAPQACENPTPVPEPADDEARWLDSDYRIAVTRRKLETTWWGGESVPSELLMANWVVCLGGTPHFDQHTIWFEARAVDFSKPTPFRHDPDSPWMAKYRKLLLALCAEAGKDDFLIGKGGGLPANDLLSMLMGTQEFLVALMDHPEWMAEAIQVGAWDQARVRLELQQLMREAGHDFWYGNAGWMAFWAPEPFVSVQSDVSCMLSPDMFDRFVVPELEIYAEALGPIWFHLDGGDARQHLPRLLSLPFLKVLQYTPAPNEPSNGPGHLEMYRQVQAAGKIVHIELPAEHVEPLVRELDPALLMLDTWVPSPAEGEQLLEQSVCWGQARRGASSLGTSGKHP